VGKSRLPAAWVPPPMGTILTVLGARVTRADTAVTVQGRGLGGLTEPAAPLDLTALPDPATALALLAGLLATQPMLAVLLTSADTVLPEGLIATLERLGARPVAAEGGRRSPLTLVGTAWPQALDLSAEPPSFSAAPIALMGLTAGLNSSGETRVPLPGPLAEALEPLLAAFGVPVHRDAIPLADGSVRLCLTGQAETRPVDIPQGF